MQRSDCMQVAAKVMTQSWRSTRHVTVLTESMRAWHDWHACSAVNQFNWNDVHSYGSSEYYSASLVFLQLRPTFAGLSFTVNVWLQIERTRRALYDCPSDPTPPPNRGVSSNHLPQLNVNRWSIDLCDVALMTRHGRVARDHYRLSPPGLLQQSSEMPWRESVGSSTTWCTWRPDVTHAAVIERPSCGDIFERVALIRWYV